MHQITAFIRELCELESQKKSKDISTEEKLKTILKLRQQIPETVLGHYDRFVKAGKVPIVAVKHGVCHGCFVKLSSGAFQKLHRQDDLNLCENCGRYIYPDAPQAEAEPTPAPAKPARARRARAAAV